jgi:phenylalanyl-tRNA synthetase beta chain
MRISFKLLSQFIHLEESPEEIAELLTGVGLEVEGVEHFESIRGGLKGLVVGEVKEVWKHPNADKLNCTTVDVGGSDLLPIVCGAPNVAAGQKVIVATVGSTLYDREGNAFEIKKAKIRGEVSQGMICAEDEIGVGDSHDGIMVLDPATEVGTPAAVVFSISTDTVFEIGLTPNRADAASHYGVARDLKAALAHKKGQKVELCRPAVEDVVASREDRLIPVHVANEEACPRYVGVTISDVQVGPSPQWLQDQLLAIGVRPINNIVDITNFINHSYGQPLHAFDANCIEGREVHVKTLPKGSAFVTLDEEERKLDDQDLMICNTKGGMCIAGVFGGLSSGVTEATNEVFLESAYFHPVWIRKTAKRHGLNTDASFRFERGVDPNNTMYAAKLAAKMMVELAGGTITSPFSDTNPQPFPPFEVTYRPEKANALIGMDLPADQVKKILENLEIEVHDGDGQKWKLNVPPFKVDVTREADVVEEVLRIYGYDAVPVSSKVLSTIKDMRPSPIHQAREAATKLLAANGFLECMTNSMTDARFGGFSNEWKESDVVVLNNPLSSELGIMRPTLLFASMQNAAYNLNRQQPNLRLFEFGQCYRNTPEGFFEEEALSITISGSAISDHWRVADLDADWYELKAAFEMLLGRLGVSADLLETRATEKDWFSYGMDWMANGEVVASAGCVDAALAKKFEIKRPVFYLEVRWAALVALRQGEVAIGQLPKFPEVRRDLALLVDDAVSYASLEKLAYQTEKKLLKSVRLFDVYQGKGLPAGKKSYGLAFGLRDEQKTLTDQEVDQVMGKLLKRFEKEVNAQLR